MKTQKPDVSKELAIFKKYGYTVDQMNNLDMILTQEEIDKLPVELLRAYYSFADKIGKAANPTSPQKPKKDLINNQFTTFVVGVVLGIAAGYAFKSIK